MSRRLLGEDHAAGQQQVIGPSEPDHPGQEPRQAELGWQPQPAVRSGQLGAGSGKPEIAVAGEHQAHPGPPAR